ncbi:MAG: KUP/HAK/KT family potassium transporter [Pirellula sp.]|jgi:KUP system potassium uptake protein
MSNNTTSADPTLWSRIRQATGTVYGDIGTSVLYTIMEITREAVLFKHHALGEEAAADLVQSGGKDLLSRNDLLGSLSLVVWSLIFLTVKYDLIVMRADHRGEGGTFALLSLLKAHRGKIFASSAVSLLVVCAAALLAADGIITPPISMLGAFEPLGVPISLILTLICLVVLFKVQWRGTSKVGGVFGWFMIAVWFPWIAIKGLPWVLAHPEVLLAINPLYAIQFLMGFPGIGALVILGVVVLAITGGEAKFADIGHFSRSAGSVPEGGSIKPSESGRIPVMYSWFYVVLPSLLLCYAGQIGYMLGNGVPPRANTFYALTPKTNIESVDYVIYIIDVGISAIAAIIASQALITGMFSIVKQATVAGFVPRFRVLHTDAHGEGQVYIPAVNWSLFLGCVMVTLLFQTSANLVAAYGVAVTGCMAITSIIISYIAYYRWQWKLHWVLIVFVPIMLVDIVFFSSTLLKIVSGGYFPMLVAVVLMAIMLVWQWGRKSLATAFYDFGVREGKKIEWLVSLRDMLDELEITLQENLPAARSLIQGRRRLVESDRAAVFLCSRPIQSVEDYVPVVLRIFLKKYGVLPSQVVLMHVNQADVATIPQSERYSVKKLGNDIHSVVITYGYMEQPDIRKDLKELQKQGLLPIAAERWIIEVGEEDIIADQDLPFLKRLGVLAFSWILKLSTPAHKYLGLVYDAAVSKEVIPVVFTRKGVKIALPELELVQTTNGPAAVPNA